MNYYYNSKECNLLLWWKSWILRSHNSSLQCHMILLKSFCFWDCQSVLGVFSVTLSADCIIMQGDNIFCISESFESFTQLICLQNTSYILNRLPTTYLKLTFWPKKTYVLVVWMKFGWATVLPPYCLPTTPFLWLHGIEKCPSTAHSRISGGISSKSSGYISSTSSFIKYSEFGQYESWHIWTQGLIHYLIYSLFFFKWLPEIRIAF